VNIAHGSTATVLALALTTANTAAAQGRKHEHEHEPDKAPLTLQTQGSFFVGGETVHTAAVSGMPSGLVGGTNEDDISVNQMYVQFQVPEGSDDHVPVVMLHGCCLSGKTYETTPDGRMGWGEHFVRKGYPVYIPDQVSRGRSGFDATMLNEVRLGTQAATALPNIFTVGHKVAWELFRFGPAFPAPFADEQFPVQAADEFGKQVIPDLNGLLPTPNPTWTNLAALAVRLKGATLMGHSESGFFPEQAAFIDPTGIRGMISIEGFCSTTASPEPALTPQQLATLVRIPTLVIFGDHLSDVPAFSTLWQAAFAGCQHFVQQVNDARGDATMLHLPDAGVFGNSHMLMQDKNNLRVADLILSWVGEHVEHSRTKHKHGHRNDN